MAALPTTARRKLIGRRGFGWRRRASPLPAKSVSKNGRLSTGYAGNDARKTIIWRPERKSTGEERLSLQISLRASCVLNLAQKAALMTETPSRPAAQWAWRTASELAESLQGRQVSALELTDAFIARIEALDGELNAVPVRDFARAREAAREADAALARGERLPLLGVPVTIKESSTSPDCRRPGAYPSSRTSSAEEDALAVARLKAAGAIVLGKTNVPLCLDDWQSYNDIHGTTNNPWDRRARRAALRADRPRRLRQVSGLCRSAPISAARCVFRHISAGFARTSRPSGSSPRAVMRRLACRRERVRDLAVIGPMARTVDDLVLALDIIAGPDETADGRAYRLALPPARGETLADFRVLVIPEHPLLPTSAAVGAALDRLSKQLVAAGAAVRQETPAPSRSRDVGKTVRQAPQRRSDRRHAGRSVSGAADRRGEHSGRRPEPRRGAVARGAHESQGLASGRFRAPGAEAEMAHPVPGLRCGPLPGDSYDRFSS